MEVMIDPKFFNIHLTSMILIISQIRVESISPKFISDQCNYKMLFFNLYFFASQSNICPFRFVSVVLILIYFCFYFDLLLFQFSLVFISFFFFLFEFISIYFCFYYLFERCFCKFMVNSVLS